MSDIGSLALVFLCSTLLTGLYRQIALRMALLDVPVFRSAHSHPVPVGGGIVILFVVMVSASFYFVQGWVSSFEMAALASALLIGLLGWVDDISELKISLRISFQLGAAAWAVFCLGGLPAFQLFSWTIFQPWLLAPLAVFGLVWLTNLYNFMDGIDGIAGMELFFVNVMSLLFVTKSVGEPTYLLSLTFLGAVLGFLVWNWSPAKIFMGDVGSGFIGFSLGLLALISMHEQSMTLWTWIILLAVFIADSTLTLLKRFFAGEKWYQGHNLHAYQKAAKRFNSHSKVTITVTAINFIWLAPLAWLAQIYPELGIAIALIAIVPLIMLAHYLGAGRQSVTEV